MGRSLGEEIHLVSRREWRWNTTDPEPEDSLDVELHDECDGRKPVGGIRFGWARRQAMGVRELDGWWRQAMGVGA